MYDVIEVHWLNGWTIARGRMDGFVIAQFAQVDWIEFVNGAYWMSLLFGRSMYTEWLGFVMRQR